MTNAPLDTPKDMRDQAEWPRVWLAPMSGSTDAAMRAAAEFWGAPAVVSEMVASDALLSDRKDMVDRTIRHKGQGRWVVQLAARRPDDMAQATAKLVMMGVDVVDINMGCPARQVVGGASGSALMREPELAAEIIAAAVEAANPKPVTLKMRLGWDDKSLNAPELASRAEKLGVKMITVHGRTRCQFYKGKANWAQIKDTVEAVNLPVIANGDISDLRSANLAIEQSGAHGVMIGRAAIGRPWLIGRIAKALTGDEIQPPSLESQCESLVVQIEDSAQLYGDRLGTKIVRKHVAAWLNTLPYVNLTAKEVRGTACRIENSSALISYLNKIIRYELASS